MSLLMPVMSSDKAASLARMRRAARRADRAIQYISPRQAPYGYVRPPRARQMPRVWEDLVTVLGLGFVVLVVVLV